MEGRNWMEGRKCCVVLAVVTILNSLGIINISCRVHSVCLLVYGVKETDSWALPKYDQNHLKCKKNTSEAEECHLLD